MDFTDKIVVVTGAGGGIGTAIVRKFTGLGAKAATWFQQGAKGNIIGKNPATPLKVSKDGGDVDAITASTITSRAFLKAVNQAYAAYAGASADGHTGATAKAKKG